MSAVKLTKRERIVFNFIREYIKTHDVPPTTREMTAALGYRTPSAVTYIKRNLVEKGVLTVSRYAARGITVGKRNSYAGRAMTERERELNEQVRLYGSPEHLTIAEMDAGGEFTAVTITKVRI